LIGYKTPKVSATHAGLSSPSISIVSSFFILKPDLEGVTSKQLKRAS
jgi:hypothetical protein